MVKVNLTLNRRKIMPRAIYVLYDITMYLRFVDPQEVQPCRLALCFEIEIDQ